MPAPALDSPEQRYTLRDYLTWDEPEKYELENGRAVLMASAGFEHNQVIRRLQRTIEGRLSELGHKCTLAANSDVVLPLKDESDDDATVVYTPDLFILCDKSRVRNNKVFGAPEFVLEVLSPSTAGRDFGRKRANYLAAGVEEYWLADSDTRTIFKFTGDGSEALLFVYGQDIRMETLDFVFPVSVAFDELAD